METKNGEWEQRTENGTRKLGMERKNINGKGKSEWGMGTGDEEQERGVGTGNEKR